MREFKTLREVVDFISHDMDIQPYGEVDVEARRKAIVEAYMTEYFGGLELSTRPEFVICSAVRASDGRVIRGHRHNDAIRTLTGIPGYEKERPHGDDQGFVTSHGRYVNRKEGCKIQKAAGIPSVLDGTKGNEPYLHGELYSEDLY